MEAHVFDVPETPEWTAAWKITEALLLKMSAAAGQRGSRLALVLVPDYAIVQPELTPGYITANPSAYDLRRPATRLTDFAKTHDILLLDLTPGFVQYRRADPERRDLFFRMDKHFTPLGNCLAAVLITNWVDAATAADSGRCR